jgi:hypothetical protein
MQSESLVLRFFRWRWAPSLLLVTGALAFALAAATLIPTDSTSASPRSAELRERASDSGVLGGEARAGLAQRRLTVTTSDSSPDRVNTAVRAFFPATPPLELPPPLEEPEPPPEPAPAPVASEMSVPPAALPEAPDPELGP